MSHDEFFAEMRQQGVEHLGQVRIGLLETDGNFSLLLYSLDDTRYGLPLFPKQSVAVKEVKAGWHYACMYCGNIDYITTPNELCKRCKHKSRRWAKAINNEIVT